MRFRHRLLTASHQLAAWACLLALALLQPASAQTPASDVSFDDSATTAVSGDDVQEALESVDAALTAIDPDATTVHLLKDCSATPNCFTTTAALTDWLWGGSGRTSAPSANDRVSVRVGPGDFDPFFCSGSSNGYVSVVGSGRDSTRFVRSDCGIASFGGAIDVDSCNELEFGDLEARGIAGVLWTGEGSATWWNVDMIGHRESASAGSCADAIFGWYDLSGNSTTLLSEHFMFNVRAEARGVAAGSLTDNIAFDSLNSDIWFYGGDIHVTNDSSIGASIQNLAVFKGSDPGVVRTFGSTIRAEVGDATSPSFAGNSVWAGFAAVVNLGGQVHLHGSLVRTDASASTAAVDAYSIQAREFVTETLVHAPGTAYTLLGSASGTLTRTEAIDGAVIEAPFDWPEGPLPPASGSEANALVTLDGADVWVETDCSADGDCAGGGDQAHPMVSSPTECGASNPWFDTVTRRCRNDTVDPVAAALEDLDDRVSVLEPALGVLDNRVSAIESAVGDLDDRVTDLEAAE